MQDIIKLLPDAIANQIAAGEVVQRPASVVKELMENAIDAGADSIRLIIKDSGKSLIHVTDNGSGMSENDARMSFERHATSKIKTSEDLFNITTMGFRGEALASIAAVAQVEMRTRATDEEVGCLVKVEGSTLSDAGPEACPQGTSVMVKNLFYNVPARRNFLKSDPVELKHIIEEFQRVSLAHPDLEFSMYQNDLETYMLKPGKLSQRITGIFGKNYREQLVKCSENTDHVKIFGYIGKPESAKRTRGEQFLFVNNRFVRNNYLNHAITTAYEGLLQEGTFPFYVLFMVIDPRHIDVNVHPTKTEIKFDDERTIYGLVKSSVKQALATHNITPSLDFEFDVNFRGMNLPYTKDDPMGVKETDYSRFRNIPGGKGSDEWKQLFETELRPRQDSPQEPMEIHFESAAHTVGEERDTEHRAAMQLHGRYILIQVKSGLMVVDQQSAHERIQYEKYLAHLERGDGSSQQSLFPQTITLNPADHSLVMEMEEEIRSLGFDFEDFGNNSIIIRGTPADLSTGNEQELFEGLIQQFKENAKDLSLPRNESLARAIARRSSMKEGAALSNQEMNSLIDQLFACSNPNYSPEGRFTYYIIDLNKISNNFN